jgi:hypothetical protein
MKTREQQIRERRGEMPRLYRGIYDKAMTGKSRMAAMRAFCLECCAWQIKEVHLCSSPACPLHPYRPTPRSAQGAPESNGGAAESTNGTSRGAEHG